MVVPRYQLPQVADPVENNDVANKQYVDSGRANSMFMGFCKSHPQGIRASCVSGVSEPEVDNTFVKNIVNAAITCKKLTVDVTSNSASFNSIFRIHKNGSSTALTVTYAAGETGKKEIETDVAFADGDTIFLWSDIGASGTLAGIKWTILY